MAPSPVRQRSACSSRDFEVDGLDHELDTRRQLAAGKRDQAAAETAGGARAGKVADRDAQVALDDRGEMREISVERLDHLRRRPFLRAVDGRGTVGPQSGLVTSQATATSTPSSSRLRPDGSILASRPRSPPPGSSSRPPAVEQAKAERLARGPAPPSLVALPPMPTIRRFAPEAIAASSSSPVPRVVATSGLRFSCGHEHQPRGGRHLDHGGAPVAQRGRTSPDRLTERPADRGLAKRAAGRGDQGVDRSFAAVGHRHAGDRRAGQALATPRAIARAASRPRGSP